MMTFCQVLSLGRQALLVLLAKMLVLGKMVLPV